MKASCLNIWLRPDVDGVPPTMGANEAMKTETDNRRRPSQRIGLGSITNFRPRRPRPQTRIKRGPRVELVTLSDADLMTILESLLPKKD